LSPAAWEATRAEIVVEAVRIARTCLAGDPLREAPDLEREAWDLFERYDGGEPGDGPLRGLPAYAIAAVALDVARMAGRSV
jgi:hypothetical protein